MLYPGKNAEPIVFPELLTKSMVLEKLETVARQSRSSRSNFRGMPQIFVSSVIAQLVDLTKLVIRNFGSSGASRNLAEKLSAAERRMNDRTREIFQRSPRARPASAVDGIRRGRAIAPTNPGI